MDLLWSLPLGLAFVSALIYLVTKQEAAMQQKCLCGDRLDEHLDRGRCMAVRPPHPDDEFQTESICGCPRFTAPKIVSRRA